MLGWNRHHQEEASEWSRSLKEITGKWKEMSEAMGRDADLFSPFKQELFNVNRAIKQFESKITIVVIMGMLKAGKSTLLNLLLRNRNVSPVGYGTDTTLRPALVCLVDDKEDSISVYTQRNYAQVDDKEQSKRHLESLLDYFRGLGNQSAKDSIDWDKNVEKFALTQENLELILCHEKEGNDCLKGVEPLLVVVKVSKKGKTAEELEKLLPGEQCMLLDMPGLDSDSGGWLSNHHYKTLISESDMVLFVQSSMAPLNSSACECLKEILPRRTKKNFWVILNRLNAKYWLSDEKVKEEMAKQKRRAKEVMSSLGAVEANYQEVNLGMAYDGIFREASDYNHQYLQNGNPPTKDSLLKESKLNDLEAVLLQAKNKDEERQKLRKSHCVDNLRIRIAKLDEKLSDRIKQKGDAVATIEEKIRNWKALEEKVQKEFFTDEWHMMETLTWNEEPPYKDWFRTILREQSWHQVETKVAHGKLNKYIKACHEDTHNRLSEMLKKLTLKSLKLASGDASGRLLIDWLNARWVEYCEEYDEKINGIDYLSKEEKESLQVTKTLFSEADQLSEIPYNKAMFCLPEVLYEEGSGRILWFPVDKKANYNPKEPVFQEKLDEMMGCFRNYIESVFKNHMEAKVQELIKSKINTQKEKLSGVIRLKISDETTTLHKIKKEKEQLEDIRNRIMSPMLEKANKMIP